MEYFVFPGNRFQVKSFQRIQNLNFSLIIFIFLCSALFSSCSWLWLPQTLLPLKPRQHQLHWNTSHTQAMDTLVHSTHMAHTTEAMAFELFHWMPALNQLLNHYHSPILLHSPIQHHWAMLSLQLQHQSPLTSQNRKFSQKWMVLKPIAEIKMWTCFFSRTYIASNSGVTHVAPLPGHSDSVISENF